MPLDSAKPEVKIPEKSWKAVQVWYAHNGFAICAQPENFERIKAEGDLDIIHSSLWRYEVLKSKGLR